LAHLKEAKINQLDLGPFPGELKKYIKGKGPPMRERISIKLSGSHTPKNTETQTHPQKKKKPKKKKKNKTTHPKKTTKKPKKKKHRKKNTQPHTHKPKPTEKKLLEERIWI